MFVWISKSPLRDGAKIVAVEGQVILSGALDESRLQYFLATGKVVEKIEKKKKKKKKNETA